MILIELVVIGLDARVRVTLDRKFVSILAICYCEKCHLLLAKHAPHQRGGLREAGGGLREGGEQLCHFTPFHTILHHLIPTQPRGWCTRGWVAG